MKNALALVAVLIALAVATIIYLADARSDGIPDWLANITLIGIYAAGLSWLIKRWPN